MSPCEARVPRVRNTPGSDLADLLQPLPDEFAGGGGRRAPTARSARCRSNEKFHLCRELHSMKAKSKSARRRTSTVAAAVLTTGASALHAEPAADPDAAAIPAEVVVTGTRRSGVEAIESPAPVRVLDAAALKRVGQPDL